MKSPSLLVSSKGTNIEPVPEGLHHAVVVGLVDVGTHANAAFGNVQRKLVLSLELPELPPLQSVVDGRNVSLPRVLSTRLTRSFNEKARLRLLLESLRSRKFSEAEASSFDLTKILGVTCTVQVLHETKSDRTFANVHALLPAPKGLKLKTSTPLRVFSVDQLEHASELADAGLPEWITKLITESEEYQELVRFPLGRDHEANTKENAGVGATTTTAPSDDPDDFMP